VIRNQKSEISAAWSRSAALATKDTGISPVSDGDRSLLTTWPV
jgi:hypothetical protein